MNTEPVSRTRLIVAALVATYALGAVIAFGHAVHHVHVAPFRDGSPNEVNYGLAVFASAIAWPFYLSQAVQRPIATDEAEKP